MCDIEISRNHHPHSMIWDLLISIQLYIWLLHQLRGIVQLIEHDIWVL